MDCILQVRVEELSANEATAFWPRILLVAPTYARYQQAASRTIPLVRLVPVEQAGEQTMPSGESLPSWWSRCPACSRARNRSSAHHRIEVGLTPIRKRRRYPS
jgi:hypothetical protein